MGDIGVEFQRWYDEAKQLASYIGTEEEMSKVPMIQCNSSKVPADTSLLHYKRSIGIPFIDILLQHPESSECFAESNTIFNCQTRDASRREV